MQLEELAHFGCLCAAVVRFTHSTTTEDVNRKIGGRTLLHHLCLLSACKRLHSERNIEDAIHTLVEAKAHPDIIGGLGDYPIQAASPAVVLALLSGPIKPDLEVRDCDGYTALALYAAWDAAYTQSWLLINAGASINSRNGRLEQTPAMIAAENDCPKALQLLLQTGADPLLEDKNGSTALSLAKKGANSKCVELLERHINNHGQRSQSAAGHPSDPQKESADSKQSVEPTSQQEPVPSQSVSQPHGQAASLLFDPSRSRPADCMRAASAAPASSSGAAQAGTQSTHAFGSGRDSGALPTDESKDGDGNSKENAELLALKVLSLTVSPNAM